MLTARAQRAPRRTVRWATLGAGLTLWVATLAGCTSEPPRRPRFEDFVVDGGLTSNLGEPEPAGEVFCADENRFAQSIRPGETLSVTLRLGADARLVVSRCIHRAEQGRRQPGEVRVTVTPTPPSSSLPASMGSAGQDGAITESLRVPIFARWEENEIDLSALADREVTLTVHAKLPGRKPLFFRDFWIEHRPVTASESDEEAPSRRAQGDRPPQVLLISVDTFREDAIHALGGSAATPALDAFVGQSQAFSPHYSGASWTQPSHAALLTGQPHRVHGAFTGNTAIHPGVPTLAERFHDAGFATSGLVFDCLWLDPRFGFDRGFDSYHSTHWTLPQSVRRTLNWLDEHREQPFFYFLHTFEVHSDFRYLPYEGPGVRHGHVARRFNLEDYGCRQGQCASSMLLGINSGEIEPIPGEGKILRYLYDRGVDHVDQQLGALFAGLRQRGLFDDMLIVLTADHGEAFLEHGGVLHGQPHEELMRVPLVIKWPGGERAGDRVGFPSGSLAVASTLLAATGVESEGLPGRDLRRLSSVRPIFFGSNFSAVRDGPLKAILDQRIGGWFLFDLAADPEELHNLAAERPADLDRLAALIRERAASERRAARRLEQGLDRTRELNEEERERLRALGYVGG